MGSAHWSRGLDWDSCLRTCGHCAWTHHPRCQTLSPVWEVRMLTLRINQDSPQLQAGLRSSHFCWGPWASAVLSLKGLEMGYSTLVCPLGIPNGSSGQPGERPAPVWHNEAGPDEGESKLLNFPFAMPKRPTAAVADRGGREPT